MAPKLKNLVKDINEVDEKYRELYDKADDGTFTLSVDDKASKDKLEEFRNKNLTLFKEKERLQSQLAELKEIDPEEYKKAKKALDKLSKLEERELLEDGDLDKVVNRRLEPVKEEYAKKLKAKDDAIAAKDNELAQTKKVLKKLRIESEIMTTAEKVSKLKPGAREDLLLRANTVWDLDENNKFVPKVDGSIIYGGDGEPMKPDEWIRKLAETADHLFVPAQGGGAQGSSREGASGGNLKKIKNDPLLMGQNAEAIAKGKMTVETT